MTSIHRAPASTRAMQLRSSISTPRMRSVLTSMRVVERAHRRRRCGRCPASRRAGRGCGRSPRAPARRRRSRGGRRGRGAGRRRGSRPDERRPSRRRRGARRRRRATSRRTATSEESGEIESMRAMLPAHRPPGTADISPVRAEAPPRMVVRAAAPSLNPELPRALPAARGCSLVHRPAQEAVRMKRIATDRHRHRRRPRRTRHRVRGHRVRGHRRVRQPRQPHLPPARLRARHDPHQGHLAHPLRAHRRLLRACARA